MQPETKIGAGPVQPNRDDSKKCDVWRGRTVTRPGVPGELLRGPRLILYFPARIGGIL